MCVNITAADQEFGDGLADGTRGADDGDFGVSVRQIDMVSGA